MSLDLDMDKSTVNYFEILLLDVTFRRLCISAMQTSCSLCAPADVQVVTEALNALQISSQQNIH